MKEDILDELFPIRYTEIKEREPLRKIQNKKKNKRTTNLSNCTFESFVREMTAGMNEYNEPVSTRKKSS